MMKRTKKAVAVLLAFAMLATSLVTGSTGADAAKKKPKLSVSKKVTIYKGSTKTVTIKNVKSKDIKSLKWKTKNKKIATVKKSSKTKAKIKGVKAGKTTITCTFKIKKKKYTFKVTVTVKNKPKATPAPTATTAPTPNTPAVTPTPAPSTGSVAEQNKPEGAVSGGIYCEDFNDGIGKFTVRGWSDSQIKLENANYGFGDKCLLVKDRVNESGEDNSWTGTQISLKDCGAEGGKDYVITAWVMSFQTIRDGGAPKNDNKRGIVLSKVAVDADGNELKPYYNLAESEWISDKHGVKRGTWVKLQATVTMPSEGDLRIFFETPGVSLLSGKSVDFYLDSFSVKEATGKVDSTTLPSIADAYRDILDLGTALGAEQLRNSIVMADVVRQFKSADPIVAAEIGGSITMGNEMKPGSLLKDTLVDASKVDGLPASYTESKVPTLDFTGVDESLKLAKQYGFKMRGHVLVWHSQTPDFFFRKDFDSTKGFVTKEVMNARLEWYIKSVLTHIQNAEGGEMIYCWDVVNEVFTDDADNSTLRAPALSSDTNATPANGTSKWISVYGEGNDEYIVNAFKFARKYASEGVELYYNDYNEYMPSKRDAIYNLAMKLKGIEVNNKPIIDGIGMQMHLEQGNDGNSVAVIEAAIDKFASTGLKVQITELDMCRNSSAKSEKFAADYRALFELFVAKKEKLDKVILWGISDEGSWRKEKYPTLWRAGFQPKMCFWEVINAGRAASGLEPLPYSKDDYYLDTAEIK